MLKIMYCIYNIIYLIYNNNIINKQLKHLKEIYKQNKNTIIL